MIKSTRHHLKDFNFDKKEVYLSFLDDYHIFASKIIDHIWSNGYDEFDVQQNKLELPKYIDYKRFKHLSKTLSARAMSSAVTQISQIIRSSVEKQRRVLWVQDNKNINVKDKKFSKPIVERISPILSSKCCDYQPTDDGKFLGFIRLKSLGSKYGEIKIPIIRQPLAVGKMQNGFLCKKHHIQVTWDKETNPYNII